MNTGKDCFHFNETGAKLKVLWRSQWTIPSIDCIGGTMNWNCDCPQKPEFAVKPAQLTVVQSNPSRLKKSAPAIQTLKQRCRSIFFFGRPSGIDQILAQTPKKFIQLCARKTE